MQDRVFAGDCHRIGRAIGKAYLFFFRQRVIGLHNHMHRLLKVTKQHDVWRRLGFQNDSYISFIALQHGFSFVFEGLVNLKIDTGELGPIGPYFLWEIVRQNSG